MSTIRLSGMASGMDTEAIVQQMMTAQATKKDNLEKELQMLEWQKEVWEEVNTKIYDFYTKDLYKMKQQSTYMKNNATVSDTGVMQVTAGVNATKGVHEFQVSELAKGSYLTGKVTSSADKSTTMSTLSAAAFGTNDDITMKVSIAGGADVDITINKDDTIAQVVEKFNVVDGLKVSYDDEFDTLFFSTEKTGKSQNINISTDATDGKLLLQSFGFSGGAGYTVTDDGMNYTVTADSGEDLEFTYQNQTFTSADNAVNINGMEINFTGETAGGTVSVVIEQDTDAVYEQIKDFVNSYNELILYINEKVYADSAKGYEPLTDEEKEAMTDEQIKTWEDKIKDSLLRRDNTLQSTTSYLRDTLTKDNSSVGSIFTSLSELGIVTGDYTERGLLHIEGDEDDSNYAIKENKLKAAIESDPEEVSKLFSKIAEDMYTELTERMSSNNLSSAFKIYNDKQIDDDIDNKEEEIEKMEEYLIMIEDRYYKQFTAMEQAIMQLEQQSASLMSMLGGQ